MAVTASNAIRGHQKVRFANDGDKYQAIGAGNNAVIGGARQGDYIHAILVTVTNNLNCAVTIQDGGDTAITVVPNVLPLGNQVINVPLGLSCRNNNWAVSCNPGAAALVSGTW